MKTIQLPWVPAGGTGNHHHQNNGRGGKIVSAAVKAYRQEVAIRVKLENQRLTEDGIEPPYRISIQYWYPMDKRRHADEDNLRKVWMDALILAGWIEDDRPTVITSQTPMLHQFYAGVILPNGFVIEDGHGERGGLIFVGLQEDPRFHPVTSTNGFPK